VRRDTRFVQGWARDMVKSVELADSFVGFTCDYILQVSRRRYGGISILCQIMHNALPIAREYTSFSVNDCVVTGIKQRPCFEIMSGKHGDVCSFVHHSLLRCCQSIWTIMHVSDLLTCCVVGFRKKLEHDSTLAAITQAFQVSEQCKQIVNYLCFVLRDVKKVFSEDNIMQPRKEEFLFVECTTSANTPLPDKKKKHAAQSATDTGASGGSGGTCVGPHRTVPAGGKCAVTPTTPHKSVENSAGPGKTASKRKDKEKRKADPAHVVPKTQKLATKAVSLTRADTNITPAAPLSRVNVVPTKRKVQSLLAGADGQKTAKVSCLAVGSSSPLHVVPCASTLGVSTSDVAVAVVKSARVATTPAAPIAEDDSISTHRIPGGAHDKSLQFPAAAGDMLAPTTEPASSGPEACRPLQGHGVDTGVSRGGKPSCSNSTIPTTKHKKRKRDPSSAPRPLETVDIVASTEKQLAVQIPLAVVKVAKKKQQPQSCPDSADAQKINLVPASVHKKRKLPAVALPSQDAQ